MFHKKYSVNIAEVICLALLSSAGIILIGLQIKFVGWLMLILGLISLYYCRKKFAKEVLLVYISLALLAITQITTDISYVHMFEMGVTLILAVSIPYFASRYIYKDHLVRFIFHHGRNWCRKEILYILVTAIISYFLLPFYLKNTGAYLNWSVEPGFDNIFRLFIGTNALGIWDELFFVSTVLGILRRFLPFSWANLIQSILFTSFLYELGFTGWGFIMIFIFALIQGIVFKKTESLLYVITIHLTLDFILFLALIEAHHPDWMPIFIT
ncbi:MAG: CPBP family intramembrane metalloprotease [Candidatus Komeilibacteria bacterium]|jgi:membrane protease YdiL (CAAX protease family)|nr:CPBP family intramembrane metalloprotease [Candidatus Komeilibacteria bacterium]MBT4447928.1 CPBP family intramembrane metalloprotease [Candidatus Komeilibacteria bacterium]